MSDISVNNVLSQMRVLKAQAQGVTPETSNASGANFSNAMKSAIDKVNDTQMKSADMKKAFEMGDKNTSLAEVMVASQKANVSFQALLQVRNRFIQAYQDVMNMPI